MAFAGVLVSDQELQGQFTQVELRSLKSKFLHIKSDTGKVTVGALAPEMTKIKALEMLTQNEVWTILGHHYPDSQRELDFEDFLRVYLHLHNKTTMKKGATRRSSSFLKTATTTLLHTIDESEKSAYVSHINSCFELDPIMKRYLPIEPSTNELFDLAKDGVLLCKLINLAVPGTIDERTINTKKILNPWERNENHTLCLNSAKAIGCTVVNIGTQDLAEGTPHLVLALISQIIKIQLLSDLDLKKTPELVELVDDSKEVEELMNLAPEKVLLRWVNFHLKKVGYKRVVTNFSSDLKDGEAYTYLLNALAPEHCNLSPLESKDLMERAKLVLLQAEKINCRRYLTPKDIVQGSPNLNLAFVAHLFHQRKGLSLDSSKASIAETAQNDEVSKEEKAFRYWINSLGIDSVISSSFEDVRDGWVLLEVLDKVEPGCVNWKHASRPPIKMPFKKVENCNQVIKIGKQMKFSLVNVAGNDFVQGNKKLILAFLWQLMRHNILQLLKNLKHHSRGKEITDSDILHWANSQVKKIGRESRMTSFKDKSLSSGIFFLELLTAVEPRAVSWGIVTKGVTEEEKKLNATYTISITRKLGCSVFLLPEDIIEVNPKMIMTLTASIMLWSYSNQSGDDTSSVTSDIENGVASASLSDEEGGAPHIASSLDTPHIAPSADFDTPHEAPSADATVVAPSDDATTVPSLADVTPLASSADNGDDGSILKDSISVNNGNEEASISADNDSDDRSSPNIVESAEITNVGGVSEASLAVDNLNEDSNESKDSSAIQSDTETQLHNE